MDQCSVFACGRSSNFLSGGRDSSAIGVPRHRRALYTVKDLLRLRRPDRQAIGATRFALSPTDSIYYPQFEQNLKATGRRAEMSVRIDRWKIAVQRPSVGSQGREPSLLHIGRRTVFRPGGTLDNSPAIPCWEECHTIRAESLGGTIDTVISRQIFNRPCRDERVFFNLRTQR